MTLERVLAQCQFLKNTPVNKKITAIFQAESTLSNLKISFQYVDEGSETQMQLAILFVRCRSSTNKMKDQTLPH